jgi:hypothetical protein
MLLSQFGVIPSRPATVGQWDNVVAIYSMVKEKSDYTGSCMRVWRASDSTEQDIGFSGDNLDTTALSTFCSGTSGYVSKWYDQSGNGRDAVQATSGNMPRIYESGAVHAGVSFHTVSRRLNASGLLAALTANFTILMKIKPNSYNYGDAIYANINGGTTSKGFKVSQNGTTVNQYKLDVYPSGGASTDKLLKQGTNTDYHTLAMTRNGTAVEGFYDGTSYSDETVNSGNLEQASGDSAIAYGHNVTYFKKWMLFSRVLSDTEISNLT